MNKKYLLGALGLILFAFAAHYMLVDEQLSDDAKRLIEQGIPTNNLDNNAFIHLMAFTGEEQGNYSFHKRRYLEQLALSKRNSQAWDEQAHVPAQLIAEDELPEELNCTFDSKECIEQVRQHREKLADILGDRIETTRIFIESSKSFDFEPLDSQATSGDFIGLSNLNFLISLSIYFDILDKNTKRAEKTLLRYFEFSRKVAQTSLDIVPSVIFVVSIEQWFQPLLEELAASGHQFTPNAGANFSEFDMREISLKKVVISEFYWFYQAMTLHIQPSRLDKGKWAFYIGFKPNITINRAAQFWSNVVIPENTPKPDYFNANKKAMEFKKVNLGELENPLMTTLTNPRNFIGELLFVTAAPRFLNIGIDYAVKDLNLLLFKLLIESQTMPLKELVNSDKYKDPYTGNQPYLTGDRVCYPAWIQADTGEEEQRKPVCIRVFEHDTAL